MAVIKLKPVTPGQRHKVKVVSEGLSKNSPLKKLSKTRKSTGGRSTATGRLTVEGKGGGHKRKLRKIDFQRNKRNIPARVERLEYDPNRTANIAVLLYADGERRYVLATKNMQVGNAIHTGAESPIKEGNCLPLANMPIGTVISCIELRPGKGGQLARTAGAYAELLAREGQYATVRLRSGEMRRILAECTAVIGVIGNSEHNLRVLGKAGASRHRGIRPNVRGVAKNPVDHPLGGGEGRTSGGRPACNKNGLIDGKKTRNRKKASSRWIVKQRDKRKK